MRFCGGIIHKRRAYYYYSRRKIYELYYDLKAAFIFKRMESHNSSKILLIKLKTFGIDFGEESEIKTLDAKD